MQRFQCQKPQREISGTWQCVWALTFRTPLIFLKQQQLKFGQSSWAMCVGVEAWVKMMSGTLQVELPWSRFCLKKFLKSVAVFLWDPFSFWQNPTVEEYIFKISLLRGGDDSSIVAFPKEFTLNSFVATAQYLLCITFCFVGANVSIFKLWGICLESFERQEFFATSLSPFLAELDICVHPAPLLGESYILMML